LKTTNSYSIVGAALFARPVPLLAAGFAMARAPGTIWLRGEVDDAETTGDFLARARREAREAGFACIEISGYVNTEAV
jgi:hypothetical protein